MRGKGEITGRVLKVGTVGAQESRRGYKVQWISQEMEEEGTGTGDTPLGWNGRCRHAHIHARTF